MFELFSIGRKGYGHFRNDLNVKKKFKKTIRSRSEKIKRVKILFLSIKSEHNRVECLGSPFYDEIRVTQKLSGSRLKITEMNPVYK